MKAPWHLWVVGIALLLWNSMGAVDYTLTKFQFEPYLKPFTPEQRAYFLGFPAWVVATWAIAVWGSVLGTLLLLLRRRAAVAVYAVAFVAALATMVQNHTVTDTKPADLMGPGAIIFSAVIVILAVAQWEYARRMARAGVLT